MTRGDRLHLVIPCYNEARRLDQAAIATALREMPWLQLCVVDDGSTDGTLAMLTALADAHPGRIDVLALPQNGGKADAVRQGLRRVSAVATICGFWDADLSAPLSELVELRAIFDREPAVEWVWAIRLRALGRDITRGVMRHYLGRVFATVASNLLNLHAYDTQCGAKLFRVTPLLHSVLAEPFLSRWIFDLEMLSRADALLAFVGAGTVETLVYEQPLRHWHHKDGSKVAMSDFVRAGVDLLRIHRRRDAWRRPMLAVPERSRLAADPAG